MSKIIFIPGLGFDETIWANQMSYLSRNLPDPEIGTFVLTEPTLQSNLDKFRMNFSFPVSIVGFGLGSWFALHYAYHFPNGVDKLALCSVHAHSDNAVIDYLKHIFSSEHSLYEQMQKDVINCAISELGRQNVNLMQVIKSSQNSLPYQIAKQQASMLIDNMDLIKIVPLVHSKTLFISNEKDEFINSLEMEQLMKNLNGSQLKQIPDAYHLSFVEAPETINKVLLDWFS